MNRALKLVFWNGSTETEVAMQNFTIGKAIKNPYRFPYYAPNILIYTQAMNAHRPRQIYFFT